MKKEITKDYPSVVLVVYLSLAISVLLHVAMFLSFKFGEGIIFQNISDIAEHRRVHFHFDGFILNIVSTFILAFVLYMYNMYIQKDSLLSNKTKIIFIIIGSVSITMLLSIIFTSLQPYILGYADKDIPINRIVHHYRNAMMRDFFVTMVVTLSWQLIISNYKSRKIAIENETLVAENMITRYEVLKNQLNPHFLFNSLNTLQSLIEIDKEKAMDYVQELSKVLRYSLHNQEVVTLEEEIRLANSFCKLMEIRYGDNLKFDFNFDDYIMSYQIIPLSLLVLLENAIKHNVISDKQPLTIYVFNCTLDDSLVVLNSIQPKLDDSRGNGIGLANLSERYRLKWNTDIIIHNDRGEFAVEIKLKKPNDK